MNQFYNLRVNRILFLVVFLIFGFFILGLYSGVSAKSYKNTLYTIDYFINEDSTVEVKEKIEFEFDGEFYEVSRWITLEDDIAYERCQSDPLLQCGGFDFLYLQNVYGNNDRLLDESEYSVKVGEQYVGNSYEDVVNVIYEFAPNGQFFDQEEFSWGLDYKTYGSLGFFDDYIFFYWDTASNRAEQIDEMVVTINFPDEVTIDAPNDLVIYGDTDYFYTLEPTKLIIEPEGPIATYDDYTIALKLPRDLVTEPGSILVQSDDEVFGLLDGAFKIEIDGRVIDGQQNEFRGIPAGINTYRFISDVYKDFEMEVEVKPGEQTIITPELETKGYINVIIFIIICCNCFGFLLFPFAIIYPVFRWYTKGRDQGDKKTIVPQFNPPNDMIPVLVGSLKDEKPDMVDITSTIINAAYKGYIKIKEEGKKNFKFTKLKSFEDMHYIEKKIMEDIFQEKKETTTTKLTNTFYLKLPGIKSAIYKELVAKKYFSKRPDNVRSGYMFGGGAVTFLAVALIFGSGFITSGAALIVTLIPFSAIALFGVLTMIFSTIMPAKTPEGTKILEHIKGFKMYLETAEKYTLQNLTPDLFEKYLPYAIVFGVEKDWAKKFEGIYTSKPDWYEGGDAMNWTPLLLSNSLSQLNNSASSAMSSRPSSSGSSSGWSGGGWSGGGGFSGGFSGGGAGGGGFGAR